MGQLPLVLLAALVVAAIAFGVVVLITGSDPGLSPAEPDGRAVPLPADRPLTESDVGRLRFDTALRGYRMAQVDAALRRAAYDLGYKEELISVLLAETEALRDGRLDDAETLRQAREAALGAASDASGAPALAVPDLAVDLSDAGPAVGSPQPDALPDGAGRPDEPARSDAADATGARPEEAAAAATAAGTVGNGRAAATGPTTGTPPEPTGDADLDQASSPRSTGRR
jgi:DivIVA domain-containing protein